MANYGANIDALDHQVVSTVAATQVTGLASTDDLDYDHRFRSFHPRLLVRSLLLLVAFLHTSFHLPFAACAILLFAFRMTLEFLKVVDPKKTIPLTLTSLLQQMHVRDDFKSQILCPSCWEIFEPDVFTDAGTLCHACDDTVFRLLTSPAQPLSAEHKINRVPYLVLPIQPLSSLLSEFLLQPGIMEELEKWASVNSQHADSDQLSAIWDGRIWQESKAPDGKPFFARNQVPDGELRIGVTISLDWQVSSSKSLLSTEIEYFQRFSAATTAYSPSHSSGVISFTVSNLDTGLR